MRLLAISVLLSLAACSNTAAVEQSLAQCRIESYAPAGVEFLRYYEAHAAQPTGKDDAYSAFVLACMEAKGYNFGDPSDLNGAQNKACMGDFARGIPRSILWTPGALCFKRM